MIILDLFSGLGGASQPFRDRGWDVVTVEMDPRFTPDVVADVTTWSWTGPRPTLIWASPPCEQFTRTELPWIKGAPAPQLELVHAVHRIVGESRPVWWVLENVRGAQRWIGRAVMHAGPVYMWGWFPPFKVDHGYGKQGLSGRQRSERALIPYEIGAALAVAIEDVVEAASLASREVA